MPLPSLSPYRRRVRLAPALSLLLLLLVAMVQTAHAAFSWPGSGGSGKRNTQAETTEEHAAAFAAVTGKPKPRVPKGVCLRTVRGGAHSTHAYPANNPIEDRHYVLDEQAVEREEQEQEKGVLPTPGMLHAAVFDGHGACFASWARQSFHPDL